MKKQKTIKAQKREAAKEYLENQKAKLQEQFEDTYKRRDDLLLKKEQAEKLKANNMKRIKDQMQILINEGKEEREIEKAERKEIDKFMQTPEVQKVFQTYDRQLRHMYKFYASMDHGKD